jgi:penicillin amidase
MVVLQLFVIVPVVTATTSIKIPELQHGATIIRDRNGIPHIFAMNEHDLILLQGYAHARDRFFQMDLLRRNAAGTLAELLGENVLAGDVELRTIGLRRAAKRSLAVISEEMRAALRAYASGVNAYLENNGLPPEYYALEITKVAPWTQLDSLTVAKLIAFSLSFDLEDISRTEALLTYQMVGGLSPSFDGRALFFEDLFRSAPFVPLSTIPFSGGDAHLPAQSLIDSARLVKPDTTTALSPGEYLRPKTLELVRSYVDRVKRVPLLRNMLLSGRRAKGSNEWVVGGDHTASGLPLIASDPHLPLGTPATFYQNHLSAMQTGFSRLYVKKSSINVFGSSFPGLPYVILGQNEYIAWGTTFNPSDVTDFFQEQIVSDKSSPSGLSIIHKGSLEPIILLPQVFRYNVIGDDRPDTLEVALPGTPVGDDTVIPPAVLIVPRRNNGPILSLDFDEDKGIGIALSVQYTGFSGTRDSESVRLWNHARNLDDFIAGIQRLDVGAQNIAYADIDGNIAYFTSPEIPLREDLQSGFVAGGVPPYFIRNGQGGHEWLPLRDPQPWQSVPFEILPFDEMPQVINPADGFFINANNDPIGTTFDNNPVNQLRVGGQGILYLNHGYRIGIRAGRIHQVLHEMLARGPVTFEDMQEIQADVVMLDAQVFTPFIFEAFDNATAQTAAVQPLLLSLSKKSGVREALKYLRAWDFSTPTGVAEGYDSSDFDGERFEPSPQEIDNSIAATIYSVWRSRFIANTVDRTLMGVGELAGIEMPRPDSMRTMTALRNLLDHFDDNQGFGASGLNFFIVRDVEDARTRRDIIILRSLAEALRRLASPDFGAAFGESSNQADYRWGRLHRIIFEHPLGVPFSIPPAGGGFAPSFDDLPGLATDGGFGVVDASSHDVRADSSNEFMFEFGPVRRYVGQISRDRPSRQAETMLPGGASGILGSVFYDNLLPRWLTNDTYPIKQGFFDLFGEIAEIDIFRPDSWKR